MRFHILTLFPDMVEQGLNTSIIGRAVEKGILSIEAVNIRDYTLDRHKKVDDYPYGGGAGMVMQAQPIYDAWQAIVTKIGYRPRTVYLTPQGPTFHQGMAKEYAKEEDLILLCGHYEGIDERVLGGDRDGLCLDRRLCADRWRASGDGHGGRDLPHGAGRAEQSGIRQYGIL